MTFNIEIVLDNPKFCDGCPMYCCEGECHGGLSQYIKLSNDGNLIRPKECIDKYES